MRKTVRLKAQEVSSFSLLSSRWWVFNAICRQRGGGGAMYAGTGGM